MRAAPGGSVMNVYSNHITTGGRLQQWKRQKISTKP